MDAEVGERLSLQQVDAVRTVKAESALPSVGQAARVAHTTPSAAVPSPPVLVPVDQPISAGLGSHPAGTPSAARLAGATLAVPSATSHFATSLSDAVASALSGASLPGLPPDRAASTEVVSSADLQMLAVDSPGQYQNNDRHRSIAERRRVTRETLDPTLAAARRKRDAEHKRAIRAAMPPDKAAEQRRKDAERKRAKRRAVAEVIKASAAVLLGTDAAKADRDASPVDSGPDEDGASLSALPGQPKAVDAKRAEGPLAPAGELRDRKRQRPPMSGSEAEIASTDLTVVPGAPPHGFDWAAAMRARPVDFPPSVAAQLADTLVQHGVTPRLVATTELSVLFNVLLSYKIPMGYVLSLHTVACQAEGLAAVGPPSTPLLPPSQMIVLEAVGAAVLPPGSSLPPPPPASMVPIVGSS